MRIHDAVNDWITHVQIGACHIYFCPEHSGTFRELAVCHSLKKIQVFFYTSVSVRAFLTRLGQGAPVLTLLFGCQIADKCLALFDQFDRACKNIIKIIGCKISVVPVKAKPFNVLGNGVNIFRVLFCGIRVIKPQIANAVEFFLCAKVDAYGFCVADMQVAVRLRRKTGLHAGIRAGFKILFYDIVYKI